MTNLNFTEQTLGDDDGRKLDVDKALALIGLFERAQHWLLAPQYDGCFDSLELARQYVQNNPGMPLMVVITRPNNQNAESFLVHFKDERFYLEDDSMGGINGTIASVEGIPELGAHLMQCMFGDNACHSF